MIASGQTSVPGNLNATLTIPNASATLSGDLFELVASNSGSTTNLFVTLYNPPAPITVDYTSSVLYSNRFLSGFGGGAWSIDHQHPTVANVLVGGTNSVRIDSLGTNDTGALQSQRHLYLTPCRIAGRCHSCRKPAISIRYPLRMRSLAPPLAGLPWVSVKIS